MSIAGNYECTMKTPAGAQKATLTINIDGDNCSGGLEGGPMGLLEITDGQIDGNTLTWSNKITKPMPATLNFSVVVEGDTLTGSVQAGKFPKMPITGKRVG